MEETKDFILIEWFRKLLKELPEQSPVNIELFRVCIKLNEQEYYRFSIEIDKYAKNNGGIARAYNGNENQDYIEVQIRQTFFTVYKQPYREDPFRQCGKLYNLTDF